MAIGELLVETLGGLLRLIAQWIFEIGFEVVIKGTGYLLCRPFKRDIDPESAWVALVGMLFWCGIAALAFCFFRPAVLS